MTDGNLLFDGASLVLMVFALSTYFTSVKPAITIVSETSDLNDIILLKNIRAAHFFIVLSITGIIGLQMAHYLIMKKSTKEEEECKINL